MRKRQFEIVMVILLSAVVWLNFRIEQKAERERERVRAEQLRIRTQALERCTRAKGVLVRFYQEPRYRCMKRDLFLGG